MEAAELGYTAFALTDHNGVSGSMEFAQAAKSQGFKAIHGAEVDLEAPADRPEESATSRCWSSTQTGWRNLCHILTRAHAHSRDRSTSRRRAVPLETLEEPRGGPRLPERLRATTASHDEPTLRRLLAAFGRDGLRVELQRPVPAPRPRAQPGARRAGARASGSPRVATGNVHAHARARAPLQDAFVALRNHMTLDASEPVRRGNASHVLASPAAMAARFEDHPRAVAETAALAERLSLRPHAWTSGYRYPGRRGRGGRRASSPSCAGARWTSATRPAARTAAEARRAAGGGAARDRRARPGRLLPAAPRPARARARGRRGGARARTRRARCCRPGAGAGPRCPRSSVTSPASRTSIRSPTSCSSGASSTRS